MMTITSSQLENVAKFIDGLNELSAETGVVILAEDEDALLKVDGENVGLYLADAFYEEDGYAVTVGVEAE